MPTADASADAAEDAAADAAADINSSHVWQKNNLHKNITDHRVILLKLLINFQHSDNAEN